MGLDMYLEKMPRYKNTTIKEVHDIQNYLYWMKKKNNKSFMYTLKQYCGVNKSELPEKDVINFYSQHFVTTYYAWDTEHTYPFTAIVKEVAYWRKANHIHNWFVQNIQDGIDDCDYHREVTREDLAALLDVCQEVLRCYKTDKATAKELLPTSEGFFFGSTEYDDDYIDAITYTANTVAEILDTTDFETEMIYYLASW